MTVLTTARLRLIPVGVEDAEEMAAVLSDPSIYRYIGGQAPTVEALRSQYAIWSTARAAGRAHWRTWIVRLREGGDAVGYVQTGRWVDQSGVTEARLAWVVGVPWQARRLAKEAVRALGDWVREDGADRLTATIAAGHAASEAVATSLGMVGTDRTEDGERVWSTAQVR